MIVGLFFIDVRTNNFRLADYFEVPYYEVVLRSTVFKIITSPQLKIRKMWEVLQYAHALIQLRTKINSKINSGSFIISSRNTYSYTRFVLDSI